MAAHMELHEAIVVVTGGTAGVGRATARAFAKAGADVAVLARGRDGLEGTRRDIERHGVRALALEVDVADAAAVDAAATRVEQELGPIDVWVNNAMTAVLAPLHDTSPEDFRRVTDVAYHGFVYGTMSALRRMRPRDRGVVVQVGSALAYRGIPLQSSYCGAKHAIQGFTESVRTELLHDGSQIHITMVQLPGMNTPQFGWVKTTLQHHPMPVPPIFEPEVAARAIVWSATHRRRELWVTATTVKTIVGNALAPSVADRVLARRGIEGQQTDDPIAPDRPHYLDHPLPGDHGAHGRFGEQAKRRSPQLFAARHRRTLTLGALALSACAGELARRHW